MSDLFAPPAGADPGAQIETHPTRVRTYQAPDPTWASLGLCEKIRQRLWKMDPRLNLWWNPHWPLTDLPRDRGRWAIMYWKDRTREWSVVFYHEGPTGEYRPLDEDCVEHLIRRLEVCMRSASEVLAEIESREKARKQRSALRFEEAMIDFGREANRFIGVYGQKGSARRSRARARIDEARAERLRDIRLERERRERDEFRQSRGAQEFHPS